MLIPLVCAEQIMQICIIQKEQSPAQQLPKGRCSDPQHAHLTLYALAGEVDRAEVTRTTEHAAAIVPCAEQDACCQHSRSDWQISLCPHMVP